MVSHAMLLAVFSAFALPFLVLGETQVQHYFTAHETTAKAPLPVHLSDMSATVINTDMAVVIGGCAASVQKAATGCTNVSSKVYVYSAKNDKWVTITSAPHARLRHTAFLLGTKVYVAGGLGVGEAAVLDIDVLSLDLVDLSKSSWTTLATKLSTAISDPAGFVLGEKGYLFGGYKPQEDYAHNTDLISIDMEGHYSSTAIPSTVNIIGDCKAVTVNGKAYVLGGFNSTWGEEDDMVVFDGTSWERHPSTLEVGRGDFAVTVKDSKIWVFGGEAANYKNLATIEVFDPSSDSWSSVGSMAEKRFRFDAFTLSQNIYVIGGQVYEKELNATYNGDAADTQIRNSTTAYSFKMTQDSAIFALHRDVDVHVIAHLTNPLSDMTVTKIGEDELLVVGGCMAPTQEESTDCTNVSNSATIYTGSTNRLTAAAQMPVARHRHAAALRGNKVYLFGGIDSRGTWLRQIDVYDVQERTWKTLSSALPFDIADLVAFTLQGDVYAWGGYHSDYSHNANLFKLNEAEVLSDEGEHNAIEAVGDARAVVINDLAYIIGGFNTSWGSEVDVEIFDGTTWISHPAESRLARGDHVVIAENDGLIYVYGGELQDADHTSSIEVFDPVSGEWYDAGELPFERFRFEGALLHDTVILFGGQQYAKRVDPSHPGKERDSILSDAIWKVEKLDKIPARGFVAPFIYEVRSRRELPSELSDLTATRISEDEILIAGGCIAQRQEYDCSQVSNRAYIYNAKTDSYLALGDMPRERHRHAAGFRDGKVYLIGGLDSRSTGVTLIDVFTIAERSWSTLATPMPLVLSDLVAFTLGAKVYFFGGYLTDENYAHSEKLYSISLTDTVTIESGSHPLPRGDAAAVVIDNVAYIVGGFSSEWAAVSKMITFDGTHWREHPAPISVSRGDAAVVGVDGLIFVLGGELDNADHTSAVEIFNPALGKWSSGAPLPDERFRFAAQAVGKSIVLFGGQQYARQVDPSHTGGDRVTYGLRSVTEYFESAQASVTLELHGCGEPELARFIRSVAQRIQDIALLPLRITYTPLPAPLQMPYSFKLVNGEPQETPGIKTVPIGRFAFSVLANVESQSLNLDVCQLAKIFRGNSISNWDELGLKSFTLVPVIFESTARAVDALLRKLCPGEWKVNDFMKRHFVSAGNMHLYLANTPGAIAFVPREEQQSLLTTVAVKSANGSFLLPSRQAVQETDGYPLVSDVSMQVQTDQSSAGSSGALLEALLSYMLFENRDDRIFYANGIVSAFGNSSSTRGAPSRGNPSIVLQELNLASDSRRFSFAADYARDRWALSEKMHDSVSLSDMQQDQVQVAQMARDSGTSKYEALVVELESARVESRNLAIAALVLAMFALVLVAVFLFYAFHVSRALQTLKRGKAATLPLDLSRDSSSHHIPVHHSGSPNDSAATRGVVQVQLSQI